MRVRLDEPAGGGFNCPSIFDLRYWRKASRETADWGGSGFWLVREGVLQGGTGLRTPIWLVLSLCYRAAGNCSPTARSTLTDYSSEAFHSFRILMELSIRDG